MVGWAGLVRAAACLPAVGALGSAQVQGKGARWRPGASSSPMPSGTHVVLVHEATRPSSPAPAAAVAVLLTMMPCGPLLLSCAALQALAPCTASLWA